MDWPDVLGYSVELFATFEWANDGVLRTSWTDFLSRNRFLIVWSLTSVPVANLSWSLMLLAVTVLSRIAHTTRYRSPHCLVKRGRPDFVLPRTVPVSWDLQRNLQSTVTDVKSVYRLTKGNFFIEPSYGQSPFFQGDVVACSRHLKFCWTQWRFSSK